MRANTSFLKLWYRFFLIICGALLCCCSNTRLSGPTTDEGNPQIIAVVVDKDMKAVVKATVSVLRMAPDADSIQDISSGVKVASTKSNDDGICRFANLLPGLYSIQGEDSTGTGIGIKSNISIVNQNATLYRDTIVLALSGTIQGVVSRGNVPGIFTNSQLRDAFIQVKLREIDRFLLTDVDGKYSFANIPAGRYTIFYYATDGFYTASRKDIAVASMQVTTVDTVFLKPFPRLVPPKIFTAFNS